MTQPELFVAQAAAASETALEQQLHREAMLQLLPIPMPQDVIRDEIVERLSWQYPNEMASQLLSKTSVTELKRLGDTQGAAEFSDGARTFGESLIVKDLAAVKEADRRMTFRRPRFIEQQQLNAAERGTVYHAVMQQLPLYEGLTLDDVQGTLERMLELQILTEEQHSSVDVKVIYGFFETDLGQRLLKAKQILRETPFSYGLRAGEIYPFAPEATQNEMVLIQGVIDCLFEDEHGLILLDYKTDAVRTADIPLLAEKYRIQLELYARAVDQIWKKPVTQTYLYYFDGAHLVELEAKAGC
jgi:ATP-dependent helicase/nuclease subunit A